MNPWIEQEFKDVKNSKENLLKQEKKFSLSKENQEKEQELIEYQKILKEYKRAVEEFNDGDWKNPWSKTDLLNLNLTNEDKAMIDFIEQWDFIQINPKEIDDNKIMFFVWQWSYWEEVILLSDSEEYRDLLSNISEHINEYENLIKWGSSFNYFDKVLFFWEEPMFDHTQPDYAILLHDIRYLTKEVYEKIYPWTNFDNLLKFCIQHELSHNIDYQLWKILWEDNYDEKLYNWVKNMKFFSESKDMVDIIQTHTKETYFVKFIQDLNFLSKDIFTDQNSYNKDLTIGHPEANYREFFASFMTSIIQLQNEDSWNLEKRRDLYIQNNKIEWKEGVPEYNSIKNEYLWIIEWFLNIFNETIESKDINPKQYQLIKSLINIFEWVHKKITTPPSK